MPRVRVNRSVGHKWNVAFPGGRQEDRDSVGLRDAAFVVFPEERRRTQESGQKTLHAVVEGELDPGVTPDECPHRVLYVQAGPHAFVLAPADGDAGGDASPVSRAVAVILDDRGRVWARDPAP